jgi:hypothetical protein
MNQLRRFFFPEKGFSRGASQAFCSGIRAFSDARVSSSAMSALLSSARLLALFGIE